MGFQPRRGSDIYTETRSARPEYKIFNAVVTSFCTRSRYVYLKELRDDAQKPLEFRLKMQLPRRIRVFRRGELVRFGKQGDVFSDGIKWREGVVVKVLASPYADDDRKHYAVAFTTLNEFNRSVQMVANPEFIRQRKWFKLKTP